VRADAHGSPVCRFPNIALYQDGPFSALDANSFLFSSYQQMWLDSRRNERLPNSSLNLEPGLLPSLFLQCPLTIAGRGQHLIERRLLAQALQQRIIQQGSIGAIVLLHRGF